MTFLMILPVALLVAGLLGTLVVVIKRNTVTPDVSIIGGMARLRFVDPWRDAPLSSLALSAFLPHLRPA
ncbi:hypothetical protein JS561_09810 [Salmonella enterica subsp. enterica serovar Infantis]|nr:hypothetical protein JS561_09810 [Salmonella enterica subsp. enterica serovar Infantis]